MSSRSAILLIHCPDQKGLVAAVTEFISKNGGNILALEQHVDPLAHEFFMRVEWDLATFAIPDEKIGDFFDTLIGKRHSMTFKLHFSDERLRMALFVSKPAHCLYDILGRVQAGEWQVDIPLMVSNHPTHAEAATKNGIPFHHFPIDKDNRAEQEQKQIALLRDHNIDLVVLARYMIIVGAPFIEAFPERMINIHHAFLPAFIGAKPYHRAYERGVKLIGATAHYVTADLDEGPIIEQDVIRVSHMDSIDELTRKGFDVEKITLARAIRRHLERKTLVYQNRVIVFN
jgi:formyltetrahydrofolate deformylase